MVFASLPDRVADANEDIDHSPPCLIRWAGTLSAPPAFPFRTNGCLRFFS